MNSKFKTGDIVKCYDGSIFLICGVLPSKYLYLNDFRIEEVTRSVLDSICTVEILATRQYNGVLTQEEIDELLKQLQSKVDEVSQTEFDFSSDDDDCYPPVIRDWYHTDEIGCDHKWKPVLLLNSTVYDCVKCGAKKESM